MATYQTYKTANNGLSSHNSNWMPFFLLLLLLLLRSGVLFCEVITAIVVTPVIIMVIRHWKRLGAPTRGLLAVLLPDLVIAIGMSAVSWAPLQKKPFVDGSGQ